MNRVMRQYTREFGIAMLIYVLLVPVVVAFLPSLDDSVWRFALALLPVVPVAFGMRAFLRALDGSDELQLRIQLSAIAFAAGMTGMLTFAYGWLEIAGLPRLPMIWVFPTLILLWGLGLALANRRYR
ncbi:MAG: hypothetical protein WDZ49_01790 [Litorilinea sp.]